MKRSVPQTDCCRMGCVRTKHGVMGGDACFAGTRVPINAVWAHIQAGKTWREIVWEFPSLSRQDVNVARKLLVMARRYLGLPARGDTMGVTKP